jgi:hypothetical protein
MLEFAGKYGTLGFPEPVTEGPGGGPILWAEPQSLWANELLAIRHLYETWHASSVLEQRRWFHSSTVRGAYRLLEERIRWGQDNAVVYHVKVPAAGSLTKAPGGPCTLCFETQDEETHLWRLIEPPIPPRRRGRLARGFRTGDVVEPARYFISREINERLRGHVDFTLWPFAGGPIRYVPDSLLAAIYVQFALEVSGRLGTQRECQHCHNPFFPNRRDQRFCSKQCRELAAYYRRRAQEEERVGS